MHKNDIQKSAAGIVSEILSGSTFHNIHGLQESYVDAWYGAMRHPEHGCFKVALKGKDGHTAAKYAAVTEKVYPNEALPTMALMDKLNNALKIIVTEDINQCPECEYKNPTPEELDGMSEAKREKAIKVKMNEEGEYLCYNEEGHEKVPYKFSDGDVDIVTEMATGTSGVGDFAGTAFFGKPVKQKVPALTKNKLESTIGMKPKANKSWRPKGLVGPNMRNMSDDIDRIAGIISEDLI